MKGLFLAFIFAILFLDSPAQASAPYRRLVSFEWENIEGAKSYELEIRRAPNEAKEDINQGKRHTFKVSTPSWKGHLAPGNYIIRLRSSDHRNVPGDWSPDSDFHVGLDPVTKMQPKAAAILSTSDSEKSLVNLTWAPVDGADFYEIEVFDANGVSIESKKVEKNKHSLTLPVANQYSWKVVAANNRGIRSETSKMINFTVIGKELASPKISKPESEFVREIRWTKPTFTETYDVVIFKYDTQQKKWARFKVFENTNSENLDFDSSWPGGKYQVAVRSKGHLRKSSPLAKTQFSVISGDRSPAAEMKVIMRRSIERASGWYGIASYLVTEIQYSSKNPENNSAVSYDALGGTARVGLGWFKPRETWGFLGIMDLSGFTFNGDTKTFASLEANAVYRRLVSDRAEIRLQAGPYYKELPETIGDPFTRSTSDYNIAALGAHVGGEYWYSINSRLGLQANAHMYVSLVGMKTPNGRDLHPTLSTQFGFLGSYRFTENFTGLVGYARREDKISYSATPNNSNLALDGDKNESTVVGNYLNIFAEWAF